MTLAERLREMARLNVVDQALCEEAAQALDGVKIDEYAEDREANFNRWNDPGAFAASARAP